VPPPAVVNARAGRPGDGSRQVEDGVPADELYSGSDAAAGHIGGRGPGAQVERSASIRDHTASPGLRIYALDLTRWEPLDTVDPPIIPVRSSRDPGVLDRCTYRARRNRRPAPMCLLLGPRCFVSPHHYGGVTKLVATHIGGLLSDVESLAQSKTGLRHLQLMLTLSELEPLDNNRQIGVGRLYAKAKERGLPRGERLRWTGSAAGPRLVVV